MVPAGSAAARRVHLDQVHNPGDAASGKPTRSVFSALRPEQRCSDSSVKRQTSKAKEFASQVRVTATTTFKVDHVLNVQ